jgi:hypothetical protein
MPDALIAQPFTRISNDSRHFSSGYRVSHSGTFLADERTRVFKTSDRVSLQQVRCAMWNWIRCYVTGHDYCVSCEGGSMFLKCIVCERRSQGWEVSAKASHTHGA